MISGFKCRSFFSADVFAPDRDKHDFILKLLDTRFATKKKKNARFQIIRAGELFSRKGRFLGAFYSSSVKLIKVPRQ